MKTVRFPELCSMDFQIEYLSASSTMERPYRTFRCPTSLRHYDRFFLINAGRFVITEDGHEPIETNPGDVIYLPSSCAYSAEWLTPEIRYSSVEFILTAAGEPFLLSDCIRVVLHDKNGVAAELYDRLLRVWRKGEIGYRMQTTELFLALLRHISLENIKSDIGRSHGDISAAILWLENNYIGPVSVAELARMCGMCESRFRSRFFDWAGMPPIQYRNRLRARKAAELLESGEYTVSEAAELVGIPDTAYFNRVFKRYCGQNPSEVKNTSD